MWLCDVFGLSSTSRNAIEGAFDPVISSAKSPRAGVSRTFAASPKRQAGGAPAKRAGLPARWMQSGIVPMSGVKVP
ncbi:hypothetical protein ABQZ99_007545 [Xanthomonas hortorum pv. vitians]|uniref:Uncharacterized protein n=3 Tax=Xanthomonas hortorum TaxID=56454 RepID=A0A6V7ETI5_9XANT|nr:hypothetical protein [Xanthomonas hortorum]CAH2707875.1 hypothetical protein NCPPB1935_08895 [Xanthomonas campestris pv. nigromaculans]MCE4371019.1 hypothetical protein [Xanthomonas hortorum pv. hederae]MCM5525780.1 hypothetical protein [Xanthomonas hortorum pv. pelargonii]MCM5538136.1 hypothetical protein [Xanthomonas hortorum pv. pelargonii]MCM5542331.1 hypothetical protein [Xanthomonas hortorum pv. pelargonii]